MLLAGYILHVHFLVSVEDTQEILNALFIIYWIPFWDSLVCLIADALWSPFWYMFHCYYLLNFPTHLNIGISSVLVWDVINRIRELEFLD